jgi:hypothetical protein
MIITDIHVQQVLKAYSRQLSSRPRLSNREKVDRDLSQKDQVTLSTESKKMWIVDKIAKEIISQLARGGERSETAKDIINRLSQEYGQPLEITSDEGNGIIFKVLGGEKDDKNLSLSPYENKRLQERLFDITKTVIYQQLA